MARPATIFHPFPFSCLSSATAFVPDRQDRYRRIPDDEKN